MHIGYYQLLGIYVAGQIRSIFEENRAFGETSMKVCMELHIGTLFLKNVGH